MTVKSIIDSNDRMQSQLAKRQKAAGLSIGAQTVQISKSAAHSAISDPSAVRLSVFPIFS